MGELNPQSCRRQKEVAINKGYLWPSVETLIYFASFFCSSGSILFYWGKKVVTVEYSFWVCFMKIKIDIWLWIRSYHLLAAITTSHSSFHCGLMPPALSPLLSLLHDCLCWCQYVSMWDLEEQIGRLLAWKSRQKNNSVKRQNQGKNGL